ncbi:MAG: rRNA pseudouridine2604 synthase, partial [Rhizobacter sp.]|nr:rRNA pseudouridine2604 synthase [Rhizobacter sp.]
PQGNQAFSGGRDPWVPSPTFGRPQNRAFEARSDRGATASIDNRPAAVAAGMGQKFDEKRFYEERNRAPRSVEAQAPDQRYDEQGYGEQRYPEQGYGEQRYPEQGYGEQRHGGQRPYEQRGNEQRPYQDRGDQRSYESRGEERRPDQRYQNEQGYGQQRSFESRGDEPRRDEQRPSQARAFGPGSYGLRNEVPSSFQPRGSEQRSFDARDGGQPSAPRFDPQRFERERFEPQRNESRGFEPQRGLEPQRSQPSHFGSQREEQRYGSQWGEAQRYGSQRGEAQRVDERPSARPASGQRDEPQRGDRYGSPQQHAPGAVRLSKRMSEEGLASRREADEWIAKGWIRVDGKVVSRLGIRVLPEQQITIDAKARHEQAARVTVLLNKPVGYVSGQAEDGYEPAVVLFTGENHWAGDASGIAHDRLHLKYLAPAGRLDIESVGLLVLTQDGRVARQLIGEDSDVEKEYLVRVEYRGKDADFSDETSDAENEMPSDAAAAAAANVHDGLDDDERPGHADDEAPHVSALAEARPSATDSDAGATDADPPSGPTARESLSEADLALLNHGLELDGEALIEARVEWLNDDQLRFVLREGKKRQIRRMCQAVGLQVTGLKRVRIGKVMLGDLPTGQWRYLAPGESFV